MILLPLVLALYAWGGAHAQNWDCVGPVPAYGARCQAPALPVPVEQW